MTTTRSPRRCRRTARTGTFHNGHLGGERRWIESVDQTRMSDSTSNGTALAHRAACSPVSPNASSL
jgi:hypothetical protein